MKYRIPDLKTADAVIEVLSDPKKAVETLKAMAAIRDDIRVGLEITDTVESAKKLLMVAKNKMSEANAHDADMKADLDSERARLAASAAKHKENRERDHAGLAREKVSLSSDRGQFTRTSTALKKDLDNRLEAVKAREDDVANAEAAVGVREDAVNSAARQMAEAKKTMELIRPV